MSVRYVFASCKVQSQVDNKCSSEGTAEHYLQVYHTVLQLQELCRHFKVYFLQTVNEGPSSTEDRYVLAVRDRNLFLCLQFGSWGHSSSSVRRTLFGVALKITEVYIVRFAKGSTTVFCNIHSLWVASFCVAHKQWRTGRG